MVELMNQGYLDSLITSFGDSYLQLNGKQKKSQEVTAQTRPLITKPQNNDSVEFALCDKQKTEKADSKVNKEKSEGLTEEEKRDISELKSKDRKVHAHEQAHIAAGGNLIIGGPYYEYTNGPDNKRYAVSGEVTIDTSEVEGDPEATIIKAGRIRQAALAPADPSPKDRSVAAEAATMAFRAQMELLKQNNSSKNKSQTQTKRIDLFI